MAFVAVVVALLKTTETGEKHPSLLGQSKNNMLSQGRLTEGEGSVHLTSLY